MTERSGRPGASRAVPGGRAVLLAGLGAGLWLLGQGTAAADDTAPSLVQDATAVVADAAGLPAHVPTETPEPAAQVVPPVVHTVDPPREAAPTLEPAPVPQPVRETVPAAAEPVRGAALVNVAVEPLSGDEPEQLREQAAEPVRAAGALVRELRATAVAAVQPVVDVVASLASDLPVLDALDPAPLLDTLTGLPPVCAAPSIGPAAGPVAEPGDSLLGTVVRGIAPAQADAERPGRPGRPFGFLHAQALVTIPAPDPAMPAADIPHAPGQLPTPPTPPTGLPPLAACSGAAASDQAPADLSGTVPGARTVAQEPAGEAGHEVRFLTFDPAFSPD